MEIFQGFKWHSLFFSAAQSLKGQQYNEICKLVCLIIFDNFLLVHQNESLEFLQIFSVWIYLFFTLCIFTYILKGMCGRFSRVKFCLFVIFVLVLHNFYIWRIALERIVSLSARMASFTLYSMEFFFYNLKVLNNFIDKKSNMFFKCRVQSIDNSVWLRILRRGTIYCSLCSSKSSLITEFLSSQLLSLFIKSGLRWRKKYFPRLRKGQRVCPSIIGKWIYFSQKFLFVKSCSVYVNYVKELWSSRIYIELSF